MPATTAPAAPHTGFVDLYDVGGALGINGTGILVPGFAGTSQVFTITASQAPGSAPGPNGVGFIIKGGQAAAPPGIDGAVTIESFDGSAAVGVADGIAEVLANGTITIDATSEPFATTINIGTTNTTGDISIGNPNVPAIELQAAIISLLAPSAASPTVAIGLNGAGALNLVGTTQITIDAAVGSTGTTIGIGNNWLTGGSITIGNGGAGAGAWYTNTSLTFDAASPADVPISVGGSNTTGQITVGNLTASELLLSARTVLVQGTTFSVYSPSFSGATSGLTVGSGAVAVYGSSSITLDAIAASTDCAIDIGTSNTTGPISIGNPNAGNVTMTGNTVILQNGPATSIVEVSASGIFITTTATSLGIIIDAAGSAAVPIQIGASNTTSSISIGSKNATEVSIQAATVAIEDATGASLIEVNSSGITIQTSAALNGIALSAQFIDMFISEDLRVLTPATQGSADTQGELVVTSGIGYVRTTSAVATDAYTFTRTSGECVGGLVHVIGRCAVAGSGANIGDFIYYLFMTGMTGSGTSYSNPVGTPLTNNANMSATTVAIDNIGNLRVVIEGLASATIDWTVKIDITQN